MSLVEQRLQGLGILDKAKPTICDRPARICRFHRAGAQIGTPQTGAEWLNFPFRQIPALQRGQTNRQPCDVFTVKVHPGAGALCKLCKFHVKASTRIMALSSSRARSFQLPG
ncbi:MAG: hypothetical protein WA979_03185 [Pacificimonas sp.]